MTCSHIVECLQSKGIEPEASASSYMSNYAPSNALVYNTQNHFNTESKNTQQWWMVDFKQVVSIKSYSIKAGNDQDWISRWFFYVSKDKKTWQVVDAPEEGHPNDRTFKLYTRVNARYVRINGSSPLSSYADKTSFAMYYVKFFGSTHSVFNLCTRKQRSKNLNLMMIAVNILIIKR